MLFALIFPRAQRASTYDISAERNVWLQSALRSLAIVCDYMETGLFAIVCDPRPSAIVCDRLRSYGNQLCDKLQKLQNRAARVITRSGYDVSAKHLISLRQDNLTKRRKKLKATLMFQILNGLAPDYLQDLFSIRTTKYNVRNLEMKLNLPKPNTNYLKKSFSYSAASLWNNLPNNLLTIESLRSFKREVNRFYENEG